MRPERDRRSESRKKGTVQEERKQRNREEGGLKNETFRLNLVVLGR